MDFHELAKTAEQNVLVVSYMSKGCRIPEELLQKRVVEAIDRFIAKGAKRFIFVNPVSKYSPFYWAAYWQLSTLKNNSQKDLEIDAIYFDKKENSSFYDFDLVLRNEQYGSTQDFYRGVGLLASSVLCNFTKYFNRTSNLLHTVRTTFSDYSICDANVEYIRELEANNFREFLSLFSETEKVFLQIEKKLRDQDKYLLEEFASLLWSNYQSESNEEYRRILDTLNALQSCAKNWLTFNSQLSKAIDGLDRVLEDRKR